MNDGGPNVLKRLRAAGLNPTVARIGVLQVLDAVAAPGICTEEVFRHMLLRGTRVSCGTVYRVVQQCHAAGLLLRGWGPNRKALYRACPAGGQALALRLVCPDTGRTVLLDSEELRVALQAAAERHGIDLAGHALSIAVSSPTETHAPQACYGMASDPVARVFTARTLGL